MTLTQEDEASFAALAGDVDAAQDGKHDVDESEADLLITACDTGSQKNEATFDTQEAKLDKKLEDDKHPSLKPVKDFLHIQRTTHQPTCYPNQHRTEKYKRFPFRCPQLKQRLEPIIDGIEAYCRGRDDVHIHDLPVPSGCVDDGMVVMTHYPTFSTKQPLHGEAADLTNPCMRMLNRAVQGSAGLLIMDRISFRAQRNTPKDTPEDLLPPDLIALMTKLSNTI